MRDDKRIAGQNEERDPLDPRIDAALRSYADPPELSAARVALARVMEQARMEPPARPLRGWIWGVAGAAACLVAAMVALWVMRTPRLPQIARVPHAPKVVTVPNHPAPAAIAAVSVPVVRRTRHAGLSSARREVAASTTTLPKLAVFPTPRPLTPEEQALVAFATNVPPQVQQQVVNAERHIGDPITIAALKIRPLNVGEQTNSNKER
jgi:hypothetical protein